MTIAIPTQRQGYDVESEQAKLAQEFPRDNYTIGASFTPSEAKEGIAFKHKLLDILGRYAHNTQSHITLSFGNYDALVDNGFDVRCHSSIGDLWSYLTNIESEEILHILSKHVKDLKSKGIFKDFIGRIDIHHSSKHKSGEIYINSSITPNAANLGQYLEVIDTCDKIGQWANTALTVRAQHNKCDLEALVSSNNPFK